MVERPDVVAARRASLPVALPETTTSGLFQPPAPAHEGLSVAVVAERSTVRSEELGGGREPGPRHDGLTRLVVAGAQYVLAPVEVVDVTEGVLEAQLHVTEDLDHLAGPGVVGQA